jgi:hypothetical protein
MLETLPPFSNLYKEVVGVGLLKNLREILDEINFQIQENQSFKDIWSAKQRLVDEAVKHGFKMQEVDLSEYIEGLAKEYVLTRRTPVYKEILLPMSYQYFIRLYGGRVRIGKIGSIKFESRDDMEVVMLSI